MGVCVACCIIFIGQVPNGMVMMVGGRQPPGAFFCFFVFFVFDAQLFRDLGGGPMNTKLSVTLSICVDFASCPYMRIRAT